MNTRRGGWFIIMSFWERVCCLRDLVRILWRVSSWVEGNTGGRSLEVELNIGLSPDGLRQLVTILRNSRNSSGGVLWRSCVVGIRLLDILEAMRARPPKKSSPRENFQVGVGGISRGQPPLFHVEHLSSGLGPWIIRVESSGITGNWIQINLQGRE